MANDRQKKTGREKDVDGPQDSTAADNALLSGRLRRCHPMPTRPCRLEAEERILCRHEIDQRESPQPGPHLQRVEAVAERQIAILEPLDRVHQWTRWAHCYHLNAYVMLANLIMAS